MDSNFSYIATVISILLLTKLLLSSVFRIKKKYPPSPPSFPIIGHLHLYRKPLHHCLARLSERYGPILLLRFGSRPVLVVSSAPIAEECLIKKDIIFANRPRFPSLKDLTYDFTTMEFVNYGPHWRNLRRIATINLLSSHHLNSFVDVRASEVRVMVRKLFCGSNPNGYFTMVELKSRLFELAFSNIMRMVAGMWSSDSEVAATFKESVEEAFRLHGASNIGDFLPFLGWMDIGGGRKKGAKLAEYWNEFLQGLIDEQRIKNTTSNEEVAQEKSMIGDLLSLQKTDPEYYTDKIIKGLILTLLTVGTDTSSNTIEWTMALLLNNPDKLKEARAEIDQRIGHGRLIEESDLADLPYLQCVITEALRLYPVGPLLAPHESSEECVVGGYDVPSEAMLLVNAYAIHRDPKTWSEPAKFMPERFQDIKGEGTKMFPFGMGRRRCPGGELANRVVGLGLGIMIQCFDWERAEEELIDMSEGSGLTMPKVIPLEAMYRTREIAKDLLSAL